MTPNPTADEALPFEPYGAQIPDEEKARIRKTSLYERGDTICVWINEGSLHHVQAQLTAALARAEAAEARIAVLCEEIDMKESVLSEVRTRIEAAEKALEPFAKAGAYLSSGNERDIPDAAPSSATFAVGDLRRAARALSAAGGQ
jgi:hypothetical protein